MRIQHHVQYCLVTMLFILTLVQHNYSDTGCLYGGVWRLGTIYQKHLQEVTAKLEDLIVVADLIEFVVLQKSLGLCFITSNNKLVLQQPIFDIEVCSLLEPNSTFHYIQFCATGSATKDSNDQFLAFGTANCMKPVPSKTSLNVLRLPLRHFIILRFCVCKKLELDKIHVHMVNWMLQIQQSPIVKWTE